MSVAAKALPPEAPSGVDPPDVSGIVIEDDTPVDHFVSEKQQRLLTEPLYASWSGPPPSPDPDERGKPRPFLAAANVGLFAKLKEPPIVPDAFLSLDVEVAEDLRKKENRTYFFWEMGKPPDVAIEIVSNREGGELSSKRYKYARIRVPYYVAWDPLGIYGEPLLRAFELRGDLSIPMERPAFPSIGLDLVTWEGSYEGFSGVWLRWAYLGGALVPTGAERAEDEKRRAEDEKRRAEDEKRRADAATERAERLAAKLRALGVDPSEGG